MSVPEVVLGNVLADALAHHEASDAKSLVRASDPDGDAHWLDFERAGPVAAGALEHVGTDGLGRFLFAVRARNAAAVSEPTDEPVGVLVARVIGVARRVMPIQANRQNSLRQMMREHGVPDPQLNDLYKLTPAQLLRMLEKLEYVGRVTHRDGPETTS